MLAFKTLMPPDYTFQISNLLFLLVPILKSIWDVYFKQKQGIGVDHKQSLAYACLLGILISFIEFRISPVPYFWQPVLLCVAYFFFVFDYLRNLLAGKRIFYTDANPQSDPEEDSWVDVNVYSKLGPFPVLFIKSWFLLVAISCYYFLSYITGDSYPIVVW